MKSHALAAVTLSMLVSCPSQEQQTTSALGGSIADPVSEESSPLAGQWRSQETNEEKERRLRAIDEATEHIGRLQRGMARARLAEHTSPPDSLTIEIGGSKVRISSGSPGVELQLGSAPIEVSGSQGKGRLNAMMEGARLIVVARSGDGERRATHFANGDHMTVEVAITGDKLPGSLQYVSTYVREADRVLSATHEGENHAKGR
jgi:hypothetical protein